MVVAVVIVGSIAFPAYISLKGRVAGDYQPPKTDFGGSVPSDFPASIPVEAGAKIEQSYGLDYADKRQFTLTFFSTKTVSENYSVYSDFLRAGPWTVSNSLVDPKLSFLYGIKENGDIINIVIGDRSIGPSMGSEVTISTVTK